MTAGLGMPLGSIGVLLNIWSWMRSALQQTIHLLNSQILGSRFFIVPLVKSSNSRGNRSTANRSALGNRSAPSYFPFVAASAVFSSPASSYWHWQL